jgi:SAM-dependent methyltransferase
MSILELGSGPGFVTELLLETFPASPITAVDVDESLLADARALLGPDAERVSFVQASAEETGLPAEAYDAAFARYLFQHVPDPDAVAAEASRLLRPGGVFLIHDVDADIEILADPWPPALEAVVARFVAGQAARGGNRRVGRQLLPILRRAGFVDLDVELLAANSETDGLDLFREQLDPARLKRLADIGILGPDEVDAATVAWPQWLASDPFIMFIGLMARGRKPSQEADVRDDAGT